MTTLLIIFMIISTVYTAPLQLHFLQPQLQQQQTSLQQQIMALQQLQTLQRLNFMQYHNQNVPRPLLILLPNIHSNLGTNKEIENNHKINIRNSNVNAQHESFDEDTDSVIIEAETNPEKETQKAILLIPNEGRFSIGDFISSIPFLPIEINVPDSISWIYDGIASIISGIGQRIPFRPQSLDTVQSTEQSVNNNLRIKSLHTRKVTPILLMPLAF